MGKCKICDSTEKNTVYEGHIRMGRFGNVSAEKYQVLQCSNCGVIALPPIIDDLKSYYESQQYRIDVDANAEAQSFYQIHDAEQIRNLTITGTDLYRDKIIADIGCGAGSFLDSVKGYIKKGIAVEPSGTFRSTLKNKGYLTYSYAEDALADFGEDLDLAFCFSVIEHVEEPLQLLEQICGLLKREGRIILSTPNADDVLLEALPEVYPEFFYRKVHLWYFNSYSLTKILELSGYTDIQIIPHQRFGLGNFMAWNMYKKPKGNAAMSYITPAMDAVWRSELERTMRCDYLFAMAVKK